MSDSCYGCKAKAGVEVPCAECPGTKCAKCGRTTWTKTVHVCWKSKNLQFQKQSVSPRMFVGIDYATGPDKTCFTLYDRQSHLITTVSLNQKEQHEKIYSQLKELVAKMEGQIILKKALCSTCGKPGHKPQDHAGWKPE